MIAELPELPRLLIVLLIVLTLLGAVMGYCVALILTKRRARKAIESSQQKMLQKQRAAESDLQVARRKIDNLRATVRNSPQDGSLASERERELQAHSELQAQRVQALEVQLASLEQTHSATGSGSNTEKLPTLSRRVGLSADLLASDEPGQNEPHQAGQTHPGRTGSRMSSQLRDSLSTPLSRDLDIPALAESELPGSVDELEFDLSGLEDDEASQRG